MVFKPFSHLARRSSKAFSHGYAQSLAAASQSSYTSSQTPLGHFNHYKLGKTVSLQHRENYHQNAVSPSTPPKTALATLQEISHDGSLDTYFAAWQKHHNGDEWQTFGGVKKKNWKNKTGLPAKLFERDDKGAAAATGPAPPPLVERAHSTSALDDIKREEHGGEVAALEEVNEAITKEIKSIQDCSGDISSAGSSQLPAPVITETSDSKVTEDGKDAATPSLTEDVQEFAFAKHISTLEESGKYAEIPAVFEATLRSGITPSTPAYNSLLAAAIRLSSSTIQAIPKALDVYANMKHRKVVPDALTYTLLLELLSLRALEVYEARGVLMQAQRRFARHKNANYFLSPSREAELDIIKEDGSLDMALKLFTQATRQLPDIAFTALIYRYLLEACAIRGKIDDMIRIYTHMELRKVVPWSDLYPPMIRAFAASGDLRSAVECYNGYKSLAIADNNGDFVLHSRADEAIYGALIGSYVICGKEAGAIRFLHKVEESLGKAQSPETRQQVQEYMVIEGLVEAYVSTGRFQAALEACTTNHLSMVSQHEALSRVAAAAADHDQKEIAEQAFWNMLEGKGTASSIIAMLAMYLRLDHLPLARKTWSLFSDQEKHTMSCIEPATSYIAALVKAGHVDEGLLQARVSFNQLRQTCEAAGNGQQISELIDESIEYIAQCITTRGNVPSAEASMSLLWAMVENGGLVTPAADQLLAILGPEAIGRLSWADMILLLQIEAGIVSSGQASLDIAHLPRLIHLLETCLYRQIPVENRTAGTIQASMAKIRLQHPDLADLWESHVSRAFSITQVERERILAPGKPSIDHESTDPYASTLDQRGSAAIVDELDKQGVNTALCLQEALSRLRNIRRAGRHPRYIAYAKLISMAARESRANLVQDLYGLAQQDMPLVPEYPIVKHGWVSILDAMVSASLTLGDRAMAAEYHRKLLDIGSAPSANTFGLYITTLKESTKTFDEATEAVRIFLRAKAEGVEPSSFLYNALIGKLGKARRIDDCLFYFAEMRSRGVRPTSVTYGTIVNALCRVSDERFAEELFDEMESMPNYKPRPAPYNSMMQFFLTTKRDSSKVLEYYRRMQSRNIKPTMHTYKLLIDTYATLEPINLSAVESVFDTIRAAGHTPENIHYASLIHAKGCVLHDLAGARVIFDKVVSSLSAKPPPCLYQALFESMVANHSVQDTESLVQDMHRRQVEVTPYIANTLIHGWAMEKDIAKAKAVYDSVGRERREPSTYEAMTRAFLVDENREAASGVVQEMLSRGYPSAVSSKILDILGHVPTH